MAVNKAYDQYKQNSVNTSRPEELTLMLYNGLVKFIMMAQNNIKDKDYEKANNSIVKAQNIVHEFQSTLDMKYEVSEGLALMYDYIGRRLVEANIKKDNSILEEVLGYAKELRDTWSQVIKIARHQGGRTEQPIVRSLEVAR